MCWTLKNYFSDVLFLYHHSLWDLSSLARDQTPGLSGERVQSPKLWAARGSLFPGHFEYHVMRLFRTPLKNVSIFTQCECVWFGGCVRFTFRSLWPQCHWSSEPLQFCSVLSHIRTTQWPVGHRGSRLFASSVVRVFWVLMSIRSVYAHLGLSPEFISTFLGLPLHDLRVLSASSGLRFPSLVCCIWPQGQAAWGLEKLNSPVVWWYSKFWSSSPVCLLWVFSSSDRFSIFLSRSCGYIQDYCEGWMRCVYNALQCLAHSRCLINT